MGIAVKHIFRTDAEILALTPSSEVWYERGFYYPSDADLGYFYQIISGVMTRKGGGSCGGVSASAGITLNSDVIGGVKNLIEQDDLLNIPVNYEYNVHNQLTINGEVNCYGDINYIQ